MSNPNSRASVQVADLAQKSRSLTAKTLTTQSFFHLTPVLYKDLYVGDKLKVSGQMFSRLLPLQSPAFTTSDNYLRAFFVPYRTVQPSFLDYMENTQHTPASGTPGIITRNRWCWNNDFNRAFFNNSAFVSVVSTGTVVLTTDFTYTNQSGNIANVNLTPLGSQVYKVLCGLGYDLTCFANVEAGADDPINLLPLMSYLRVFYDWFWPRNYAMTASISNVLTYLKRDTGNEQFSYQEVYNMLALVGFTYYTQQMYDTVWDNPSQPNDGAWSDFYIAPADGVNTVSTRDDGIGRRLGAVMDSSGVSAPPNGITKLGLNALNALSDFLKRNQISSAFAIDRFLARHGRKIDNRVNGRSVYLGQQRFTVGISDIAATIEDANNNLGDLAGKGVSKGDCVFECNAGDDRGLFIVLLSTIPDCDYVQGIDKMCLKTQLLEHYQPEFAKRGVDAVSAAELYLFRSPSRNYEGQTLITDLVFGYLPAWYEYNFIRSKLIGDYRLRSRGGGSNGILQKEHTFRLFDDDFFSQSARNVKHSLAFQTTSDRDQYHRLDYLAADTQDFERVFIEWFVDFTSSIPMIKDSYNFDSDQAHSHDEVTVDTGSNRFN